MQPDAGGVIQRGIDLEELKAKSTEMQQKVSKKRMLPGVEGKAKSMGLGSDTHVKKLNKLDSNPDIAREKLHSELKKKAPDMGLGSEQHQSKLMDIDKKRDKKLKSFYLDEQKAGTSGNLNASIEKKKTDEAQVEKTKKQSGAKEKWMATLKDPKASKEDIEKAKERPLRQAQEDQDRQDDQRRHQEKADNTPPFHRSAPTISNWSATRTTDLS